MSKSKSTKSSSSKHVCCQVPGCTESLEKPRKGYFATKRICPVHVKAPVVMLHGREMRFCQQCGRFHELQAFEGKKRSCMAKLDKRKEVYAAQQAATFDDESSCMESSGMMLLGMMGGLPMAMAPATNPAALQLCVPALMQLQQQQALAQALWQQQQQQGAPDSSRHSCSHSSTAWQPLGDVSPTSHSGLPPPAAAVSNSSEAAASSSSSASSSSTSSALLQPAAAAAPAAVACGATAAAAAADAAAGSAPAASEAAPGAMLSVNTTALPPALSTPTDMWTDASNLSSWSEQDLDGLLDDMLQPLECPSDLLKQLEPCGAQPTSDRWLELPPGQAPVVTSPHTASSSCSKPQSTADWAVLLSDILADGEGPAVASAGGNSADESPKQEQRHAGGAGAACNEPVNKADTKPQEDKEVIRQGLATLKTQFVAMAKMIETWEAKLEQAS